MTGNHHAVVLIKMN